MAIAYSDDLRVRVLDLIESGMSISRVSRALKISRPTLYRWLYQWKVSGRRTASKSSPPPQMSKIKDWEKFRQLVDNHGDKTQKELASLWGNVSQQTISIWLKKLGYTRKKKRIVIKSAVKKQEINFEKN